MRYNIAANSCYIMKLCSRLFVLYCRSRPKDDKFRHFAPHFEEVMGGVEPCWMARWKARAEFFLSVIELLFLSVTVEALQGKMCQNSLPSGEGIVTWSQDFRGKESSPCQYSKGNLLCRLVLARVDIDLPAIHTFIHNWNEPYLPVLHVAALLPVLISFFTARRNTRT